jgi:SAM-dependent methyltransferase
LAVGFGLLMQIIYPRLIAPLFNDFEPVDEGELASAIEELFDRAGFECSDIFTMDASRRSSHSNAYFVGFGRTKRVVLFDTLLDQMEIDNIQRVLARERAHWRKGDRAVRGIFECSSGLVPGDEGDEGLAGRRVLLLGAGGGARAVLHACREEEVEAVHVLNRTVANAEAAVREVGGGDRRFSVLAGREGLDARYDLVVNATSLGLDAEDPLPMELADLEVGAAFDLVYGPAGTAWTRHARRLGIPARDGLEMLVRQAAASLRRWLGVEPPVEAMRRAARSAADREDGGAP